MNSIIVRAMLRPGITLALALLPLPALAQSRPLMTETAATAPAGRLVLESGFDAMRDEPNFQTGEPRDRWDGPLLRLVYSPADTVELDVEWVTRVGARNDPDFGSGSDFGDVSLRAKVRFAHSDSYDLGARFGVTLPETSFGEGLGPNTLRMSAQMLGTVRGGGFALHANVGLALHDEVLRPHEQRDFLAYGVAIERAVGESLAVSAEVFGLAGRGMPGADARGEARAAVRFTTGRVAWDAGVRRGIADADGTWGFSAGLAWTLRE